MVKIFCIQKDESDILEDWILYHKYLFGEENINIIDHDSSDGSIDIIKKHGVNYRNHSGPFHEKSKILSDWMKEERSGCEFLIPLDSDEFISLYSNGNIVVDRDLIIDELSKIKDTKKKFENKIKFKFKQYDALSKFEVDDAILELTVFEEKNLSVRGKRRRKTLYPSETFIETDQGNHKGKVEGEGKGENGEFILTDMALLHYPIRGYEHFIRKNKRWKSSYGEDRPEMGNPWKKCYDEIVKGRAKKCFNRFTATKEIGLEKEVLSLRDKIIELRDHER